MRDLFHPKRSEIELTAVMHALSDPTRLDIVRGLADGSEQPCGNFGVDVAKSTLSQHFKVLRDAGLIRTRVSHPSVRDQLTAVMHALSDPTRLDIVRSGRRQRAAVRQLR